MWTFSINEMQLDSEQKLRVYSHVHDSVFLNWMGEIILYLKGLLDYTIKIAGNLIMGCMQEIARKNRQNFYTTHPTPKIFLSSVSVIVFQFVIMNLESDTAYPLNFIKTTYIIFFFSEQRFIK